MNKDGKRIGVALSGGGYRAAAFHLGTLRALHKLNVLDKVDVISSVSGGSIIAAYYALHKDDFNYFEKTFQKKLHTGVLKLSLALLFIIITTIIVCIYYTSWYGLIISLLILYFWGYKIMPSSTIISWQYNKLFFKNKRIKDLPDTPVLAVNTTDVERCRLFTFSKCRRYGWDFKNDEFYCDSFPLSKAVMASSCVPTFFVPIRIPRKYWVKANKSPWLIDGGLYDNQGTHVLIEHDEPPYGVDFAVVSDASNTEIKTKWIFNIIPMILRSVDILMMRTQKMQRQNNNYRIANKKHCAYSCLLWNNYDQYISGYVRNLKNGYVPMETYSLHGITHEMVDRLRSEDKDVSNYAYNEILRKVQDFIDWKELFKRTPSKETFNTAIKVCTNLLGLSDKKIYALSSIAEWETELQVKLYLPQLL